MKYYKVECGNGYCKCNEEWVSKYEKEVNESWLYSDAFSRYSYADGFAGCECEYETEEEEEEWWGWYEQSIWDNLSIEEITKEEYSRLINEENWEER